MHNTKRSPHEKNRTARQNRRFVCHRSRIRSAQEAAQCEAGGAVSFFPLWSESDDTKARLEDTLQTDICQKIQPSEKSIRTSVSSSPSLDFLFLLIPQQPLNPFNKQPTNHQHAFHRCFHQGPPDHHELQRLLRCYVNNLTVP